MKWYCEKCKTFHEDGELCPNIKFQIKSDPSLLSEAANFTTIAGEHGLITSQALDNMALRLNQIVGTNLSYEGTYQFSRDIQVFRRLAEEPSTRKIFETPEKAKNYLENIIKAQEKLIQSGVTDGRKMPLPKFDVKLTGYSQETDWLRFKKSRLSSITQKSELLKNNYPGIDGVTVNRFTGKQISRTTIKASINPMESNSTGIRDVQKAIDKGYANSQDIIFGPEGTRDAAEAAGLKNPVEELNNAETIKKSNDRLEKKILSGEAVTRPTFQQVGAKMAQGAVVGAAVGLTISTITNFVRYKNGELDLKEAFTNASEDTAKSALIGGALAGTSIFMPGGPIGFIGGMAIGIYVDKTVSNILDEVYGKGAYGAILNSSGYVYGMTMNLQDAYRIFLENERRSHSNIYKAKETQSRINDKFKVLDELKRQI